MAPISLNLPEPQPATAVLAYLHDLSSFRLIHSNTQNLPFKQSCIGLQKWPSFGPTLAFLALAGNSDVSKRTHGRVEVNRCRASDELGLEKSTQHSKGVFKGNFYDRKVCQ
jgi:hypothetical protein